MKLIRGIASLSDAKKPSVVTIGNFDGVHHGHQAIIKTLIENAKKMGLPSTVLTFEPTSREYFSPASSSEKVQRLMQTQERVDHLFDLGVDQVLLLEFNQELVNYSAERFITDILINGLGVNYLSVGEDFRFGQNQQGNLESLNEAGKQHGFEVLAYEDVEIDGERVSSQRIRQVVSQGDFITAERLLGRPYRIKGVVSKGQQIGRTIDYPTANIVLDQTVNLAVKGVYAVEIQFEQGDCYAGVANVGRRPTVDGNENRLEVHIFDYDSDCYDELAVVTFKEKIRDEVKFESIDELKQQIKHDASVAKDFFETFQWQSVNKG